MAENTRAGEGASGAGTAVVGSPFRSFAESTRPSAGSGGFKENDVKRLTMAGWVLLLGASAILQAQEAIPVKVILKDPRHIEGDRQPKPALIPTRLLEIPFEQWDADSRNRAPREYLEDFNRRVEMARTGGGSGVCTPGKGFPEESSVPKPGERRSSIFQVAGTEKNILLGEVVATEPVWDPVTLQIFTLVHLKVQKVVRGIDPIAVGDIVTYRRFWGTVTIRGVTLCSYANGNFPSSPRPGREVSERLRPTFLILGRFVPGNGTYSNTSDFEEFQVVEGLVHYPPGISYYYDNKPEYLENLISRFQGNVQ